MRVDEFFPGILSGQLGGWSREGFDRARFINHTGVDIGQSLLPCLEENGLDKLFVQLIDDFRRNCVVDHGSKGIRFPGCFLEHYGVLLCFIV